jgi:hypothetical protein
MAAYDPPTHIPPLDVFNPDEYAPEDTTGISQAAADARYLRLSGGVMSGTVSFNAGLSCTTQILNASASVINPSYSFITDSTSGIYSSASNIVDIATNSVQRLSITNTHVQPTVPIHSQHGSAADPSYSFQGDTDTGIYRDGPNRLGFTADGVSRITISDATMDSTIPIVCDNFRSVNVGAAGNTVYGNSNSTAGMYFDINRINFSTNSVARLAIQDTSITCNQNLIVPSGTSSSCGLQFSGAAGTGIHNTSGLFFFTLGGTNMIRFQSAQVFSERPHNFTTGSAAFPSIAASSYGSTGFYWTSGPVLNVSVSGTQAVGFETGGLKLYGSTAGNNALYSPSLLQYYEDNTTSMQFSFSPGGQTTTAGNVRFIKIGSKVTMQLPSYAVITNNSGGSRAYSSTTTIPLRFQPPYLIMQPITGILNGANSNTLNLYINAGTIYIERVNQLFVNNDTLSTYGMTLTWII